MAWSCLHYYSPAALQTCQENTLQALNVAQNQSGMRKKSCHGQSKLEVPGKQRGMMQAMQSDQVLASFAHLQCTDH